MGSEPHSKMKKGSDIYAKLDTYILDTKANESADKTLDLADHIITQRLLSTHKTQKQHFDNCMTPPDN